MTRLLAALLTTWLFVLCGWSAEPAEPAKAAAGAPLISQTELLARLERPVPGLLVLDVRTVAEFQAGHVPGALNVPHDQLSSKLEQLAAHKDKDVVLYCRSGRRVQLAEQTLRAAGFTRLLHLEGDYLAWEAGNRPVELPPAPAAAPAK